LPFNKLWYKEGKQQKTFADAGYLLTGFGIKKVSSKKNFADAGYLLTGFGIKRVSSKKQKASQTKKTLP
jgi:hypothetical protein